MNPRDWTPDLIIAAVVIVLCFLLRVLGINGEVWAVMGLAVAWVFGGQFEKRRSRQRQEAIDYYDRHGGIRGGH